MKIIIFLLFSTFLFSSKSISQNISDSQIDTSLTKKITLKDFCLCKTTLDGLKKIYPDLKDVKVEEMDLGKKCFGGDARFQNGSGYFTAKYPGIIFQKDPDENYISKFRLTKDFEGKLPNGTFVNLKNLLLKDIISQFPEPLFKWGSRGCSDYWTYSNDTISFFLKIDRNKKPQYPLDEEYYLNRPVDAIDIFISCYSIFHKSDNFSLFSSDEPMFFIDSIRTNGANVQTYDPSEFALVTVYKDGDVIKKYSTEIGGEQAKNGVIFITTKPFAREHYWNYFKSKSLTYSNSVSDLEKELKVAYILNGKLLETNYEGALFGIDDSNFLELSLIDSRKLKTDYNVSDKKIGVIIKTK